jgi:aromatic-L-amino-acid decarboxylase
MHVLEHQPAATELEQVTMEWLRKLVGCGGVHRVIQDTASTSTLVALITARDRALRGPA